MLRAGDISPRHVILHRLINDEESQPAGITQLLSIQALNARWNSTAKSDDSNKTGLDVPAKL
jgi:hypothetical protein